MNYYSIDTGLNHQSYIVDSSGVIIGNLLQSQEYEDETYTSTTINNRFFKLPQDEMNDSYYDYYSNEELREYIEENKDYLIRSETTKTTTAEQQKMSIISYAFINESRAATLELFLDYNICVEMIFMTCWKKQYHTFMSKIINHKNVSITTPFITSSIIKSVYCKDLNSDILDCILQSNNKTLKQAFEDAIINILYVDTNVVHDWTFELLPFCDSLCVKHNIDYNKQKVVDIIYELDRPLYATWLINKYNDIITFQDFHLIKAIKNSIDITKMILSTIQKTNLESFFTIYTINDILEHIFIECNIELFHFFVYTFPEATISSDALFKYLKDINVDDIPFIDKVYEYYENNGQHIQSQIHTSALTELFENACENGECIIAQWIYKNSPDINIDEIFENVFNEVCSSDEIEMALWIVSIYPNKYHVYIQHGEIIGYFIRRELNLTREINRNLIKKDIELCFICEEVDSTIYTDCEHFYCLPCITKWLGYYANDTCPYCRTVLSSLNLSHIIQ
tara:strand:+ start:1705 stop:3234 length:1530 start_codon:yes stop_codon:yes gene_type:complete